ncbi:MAG: hypothetical protein AAF311_09335 [Pseudomonadota bacterium]
MTAGFEDAAVPLTYRFDARRDTLRIVGRLNAVLPMRRIRLLASTLNAQFETIIQDTLDSQWLADLGVSVEVALVDRNRTPVAF